MTCLLLALALLLAGCSAQPAALDGATSPVGGANDGAVGYGTSLPWPTWTVPSGSTSQEARASSKQPTRPNGGGAPPLSLAGGTAYSGTLAWADPKYGPRYLALREPRGTLVEVCGPSGCVQRRSTDFGPVRSLWLAGRIADVSAADWQEICGVPLSFGLCPGSVLVLERPRVALPQTDSLEGQP